MRSVVYGCGGVGVVLFECIEDFVNIFFVCLRFGFLEVFEVVVDEVMLLGDFFVDVGVF